MVLEDFQPASTLLPATPMISSLRSVLSLQSASSCSAQAAGPLLPPVYNHPAKGQVDQSQVQPFAGAESIGQPPARAARLMHMYAARTCIHAHCYCRLPHSAEFTCVRSSLGVQIHFRHPLEGVAAIGSAPASPAAALAAAPVWKASSATASVSRSLRSSHMKCLPRSAKTSRLCSCKAHYAKWNGMHLHDGSTAGGR